MNARILFVTVAALLVGCGSSEESTATWTTPGGFDNQAQSDEIDKALLACIGDNPCSANFYCEGFQNDDPRCDCVGGMFPYCTAAAPGTCVHLKADDGLSCFPNADVATGYCHAGTCS